MCFVVALSRQLGNTFKFSTILPVFKYRLTIITKIEISWRDNSGGKWIPRHVDMKYLNIIKIIIQSLVIISKIN